MKRNWASLKKGRPGSRFEEQYERQRKSGSNGFKRALRIALGGLLLLAGVFFLPAPGPGTVILAVGALLIAREFRFAAKLLDKLEVAGRGVYDRARRLLRRKRRRHSTAR